MSRARSGDDFAVNRSEDLDRFLELGSAKFSALRRLMFFQTP